MKKHSIEEIESIMNKFYPVVESIWPMFAAFDYKRFFKDWVHVIPETEKEIRALQELVSQRTGFISERDNFQRIELINKLIKHLEYMKTLSYNKEEFLLIDKMLDKLLNLKQKFDV